MVKTCHIIYFCSVSSVFFTELNLLLCCSAGELENFHRNCATGSTIVTNTCETYNMQIVSRRVCSCDTSYCNTAATTISISSRGVALLTLCLPLALAYTLAT